MRVSIVRLFSGVVVLVLLAMATLGGQARQALVAASQSAVQQAAPTTAPAAASGSDSVTISDQPIHSTWIVVDKVVASVDGWIVIHAGDNGKDVVGHTYVHAGENDNVAVKIDMDKATPQMSAMLHIDAGTKGVYEFPGADAPVVIGGKPVNPPFKVIGVDVDDQLVSSDNKVTIGKVLAQQDGWIAIHNGDTGFPVIGYAPIKAGINQDVAVPVDATKVTDKMTAMIHIDAGTIGKYEFPGPDAPAALGKSSLPIVNDPFWTTDHVRGMTQVVGSDNTVTVPYVLAKQDGWMVIHSTATGAPVIGHTAVKAGLNQNVQVKIDDPTTITPEVIAMLHIDAGTKGTYEFPGPDAPVMDASGKPVAPLMLVQQGVMVHDQTVDAIKKQGGVLVDAVVADVNGWIAIHAGDGGKNVIGHAYVHAGANDNVLASVDNAGITDTISAMLHIDAGTDGVYEFPGPDAPVVVNGKPINPTISTK